MDGRKTAAEVFVFRGDIGPVERPTVAVVQ